MPWRGAEAPGEFPTLGYAVGDWIEAHCVIPDGDHAGEPFRLTEEMWRFLLWHYRLEPDDQRFRFRGSQLVRPQKWGKGPFASAMVCAEAEGPVLPDGWSADGEPVGRPWSTPWIQITAVSEDQTDNVWRALLPMIQFGPLAELIPDAGETRINLPGGGRIEPVTASARSRLGQRVTFVVQDETHSWTKLNGGRALADNQRRNLAGMRGRWLETTNAWDPAEESVAQQTAEGTARDVHRDRSESGAGSVRNRRDLRRMLKRVYGGSWWVDLDRIEAEVVDLLERDPAQAERFFLNRIVAAEDAWVDPQVWAACEDRTRTLVDRDRVCLGFDGAQVEDATALVAVRMDDGHLELLGLWEHDGRPGWQVDTVAVDAAVAQAHARFRVVRFYADPPLWQDYVDRWAGEYGAHKWWTNRHKPIAFALDRFTDALREQALTHPGDARLTRHVLNARRGSTRSGTAIYKDRKGSSRKIDAAMAAVLAWEARADAIAAGQLAPRKAGRFVTF